MKKRVLLIDDEKELGEVFAEVVGIEHSVLYFKSGSDALNYLKHDETFDIVFCDLTMPDLSGVEVFERISKSHPHLIAGFYFLSGGAFKKEVAQWLQKHRDVVVIDKPFEFSNLLTIIDATEVQRLKN